MEEFVEISGELVELYAATEITGLTMQELKLSKSYVQVEMSNHDIYGSFE